MLSGSVMCSGRLRLNRISVKIGASAALKKTVSMCLANGSFFTCA